MTQFDVFPNPIPSLRTTHPYVVVLQSDLVASRIEAIVAPLTARSRVAGAAGRLMPVVALADREFVVLTQALTALPARDLKRRVGNLSTRRAELLGALDLLFFGI